MYLGESTDGGFWDAVGSAGRAILPTITSVGGQLFTAKAAAEAQVDAAKKEQRMQLLAQAAQRKAEKKAERFALAQEQAIRPRAINPVYIAGGISAVAIAGGAWWYIATRKKKKEAKA